MLFLHSSGAFFMSCQSFLLGSSGCWPARTHVPMHEDSGDAPMALGLEVGGSSWPSRPGLVPQLLRSMSRLSATHSSSKRWRTQARPCPFPHQHRGTPLPALGRQPQSGRGLRCAASSRLICKELNQTDICLPALLVPSSLLTCSALMRCDVFPAVVSSLPPLPPSRELMLGLLGGLRELTGPPPRQISRAPLKTGT